MKKPKKPFVVVNDRGDESLMDRMPPRIRKIIDFLDSFEDGKVLKTQTLSNRLAQPNLRLDRTDAALREYRAKIGGVLYWGNKKTIKEANEG